MDSSELSCDSGWAGATVPQRAVTQEQSLEELSTVGQLWAEPRGAVTHEQSLEELSSSIKLAAAGPEEGDIELPSKIQKLQPIG